MRLTDGLGNEAEGELVGVDGERAELHVGRVRIAPPSPIRLVLLGTPKPALVEEAATLATEGGATALWLVASERSHPGTPRLDRLERVVDSATRQCRRADRPELAAHASLSHALTALDWLPADGAPRDRYVAQPGAAGVPAGGSEGGVALAVGPEGGWAPSELGALAAAGFIPLGLGPHVLRAPTAVLAGLTALAVGRLSCW